VALTGNVLTNNDTDEDATFPHTLSAVAETVSSTGGGTATINANGSFTFLPGVGDKNQNDAFTYNVTDGTATSSGTVTVGISNSLVWYVDNSKATNGDGRSSSPLNTLTGVGGSGASDGPNDILFLYQGSGNYTGGLPLEASQQLIGQPNGLSVNNGITNVALVPASGNRPTITNASGNGITLGTGNTIRSVNVGNASGSGILGNTFGTLDVGNVGVNTTGQALSLTTGTLSGSLSNVSSSGGTNNVLLSGVGTSGTFDLGSGSLSGATSDAFKVVGSGSFSYSGGISQGNNAPLVGVSGGHNGTLTFGTGTLSATNGTGLQFDNADGTYNFNGTTTLNGGDAGIDILNGSTGAFTFGTGTAITNPSGTAFNLSGATPSNAAVTYSGSISKNNAGFAVDIDNHDSGTVTFQTGTLSSTGTSSGVRVANSNGGKVNFNNPTKTLNTGANKAVTLDSNNSGGGVDFGNGGLDIDTTSGGGFSAAGGGTVNVTGSNNTIDSTTTGTALNVSNTTIGSNGLTFQSISAGPASGTGPTNGIVLNNTGTSGGLTVTGNGGTCTNADTSGCSGGQIRNTTGADDSSATPVGTGIVLNNTKAPSLTRMWLHDNSNYAMRGTSVSGFTLANSVINGTNGNNGTDPFNDSSIRFNNLTGSASVSDTAVSGGLEDNIDVTNSAGSLDRITFTNVNIGLNSTADGNDGIGLESTATASAFKATIQNSTFTGSRGDLVDYSHNGSGLGDLVISGSSFSNNHPGIGTGGGLTLSNNGTSGNTTMSITNNTFRDAVGPGVLIVKTTGPSTQTGTFSGNTIGVSGVANSGSAEGSALKLQTVGQGAMTWGVTNNQIRGYNNNGIEVLAGGGATLQSGAINTTITGNTIAEPGNTAGTLSIPKNGIHFNIGTVPRDTYQACAAIGGAGTLANAISTSGKDGVPATVGDIDFRLRQRQSTTLRLPGYGGANNDNTAVQNFVAANNGSGGVPVGLASNTVPTGGGFTGTGTTCP